MGSPLFQLSDFSGNKDCIFMNWVPITKAITYLHQHDFIEIAYVVSGKGVHIQEHCERPVQKGSIFIIDYNVPHAFQPLNGKLADSFVICNCIFKPEFMDSSLVDCRSFTALVHHCNPRISSLESVLDTSEPQLREQSNQSIFDLFEKLFFEYRNQFSCYRDIMRYSILELFIRLHRLYFATIRHDQHVQSRPAEAIAFITHYIKCNYAEKIRLEGLAAMVYLSPTYLCKLFKDYMGVSIFEYVQEVRISNACRLLETTMLCVAEIAAMVGYSDLKYFYKLFEKLEKSTPGHFRSQHILRNKPPGTDLAATTGHPIHDYLNEI